MGDMSVEDEIERFRNIRVNLCINNRTMMKLISFI